MPSWKKVIVSGSDAILNSVTASNGFFGTSSWAASATRALGATVTSYVSNNSDYLIPLLNASNLFVLTNPITQLQYNPSTQILTATSSNAVSSSYTLTASYALSSGGGGTPGGSDTSIQYASGSTFSGNTYFTYDYTIDRFLNISSYDFASTGAGKNFAASIVSHNTRGDNSQRAGIAHWQNYLNSGTGATTIYRWNATPNGSGTNLDMYGFKCDYSLLLVDSDLGLGNNVASRIGTLKAAWSWSTANAPVLNDDFVDGDLVYNELGLVTFTLQWNDPFIELQMDCTNVTAGRTYFNGIFTNFGVRGG